MNRIAMNRITILIATLILTACASTTPPPGWKPDQPSGTANQITTERTAEATPAPDPIIAIPELRSFDPLGRALTSPTFVKHATAALAITDAPPRDPIFGDCLRFELALGQELQAKPLVVLPNLTLPTVDPSCALCVIAAKRKDLEMLQSGTILGQAAEVRARVRDYRKRAAVACGPWLIDEGAVFGLLAAAAGAF